nr:iron-sulfur cluster biosynthesis family protein [Sciscionella marina]
MLAVTDAAANAINALTAQDGQQQGSGLRFAIQQEQGSEAQLAVSVTDVPEQNDQVLGSGEAKVFLEPEAAQFLDDKVLDVEQDDQGQLNFAVFQQPEG